MAAGRSRNACANRAVEWAGRRGWLAAAVCLCALAAPACVQPGTGSELATRPRLRSAPDSAGKVLRIPADEPFAIRTYDTIRRAEIDGEATADAGATVSGTARAEAAVQAGGEASGMFQLGHALRNDSVAQIDLLTRVRFSYEFETAARPPADLPDAVAQVHLFARDARNRLIRTLPLVVHSTDQGDTQSRGQKDVTVRVTLGPGESISMFLSGSARVQSLAPRGGSARIAITGLEMEFESRPAPPVTPASAPAAAP